MSSASTARGSTRTLPANAGLALAGDLAGKIAAFAGVVMCARLLPVREFAHLGIAIAAVTVFAGVVDSGFSTLIVRDGAQRSADPMALLRSSLPIRVPLAALVLGTAVGGALYLGDFWLGVATAFAATGSALSLTVSALFRAKQDLAPEAIQRCVVAGTTLAAVAITAAEFSRAAAVVWAMGGVCWLSLVPLWRYARHRFPRRWATSPRWGGIRAAAPFGLMALATLLYYRLGIFVLGAVSSQSATANFTIASTIAFGLLTVPNAITTGLLPRLSAHELGREWLHVARRALRWTLLSCLAVSGVAAVLGPWALRYGFGSRYESALTPLVILLAGTVVIGVNGLLGTALIALRHTRIVAIQVGVSLAVCVGLGLLLVPRLGATGAAVATLGTELVGLGILAAATHRLARGLIRSGTPARRGHRERGSRPQTGAVVDLSHEVGS